jgi:putative toxin-antitoxin system antitoxin component (TIGR02293 family)
MKTATNAQPRIGKHVKLWRDLLSRRESLARLYRLEPAERVELLKEGVPARFVVVISDSMAIPKDRLYATIGLVRATVNRKVREEKILNQDESERVMGIARMVGQAEAMVKESGDPRPFDAAKWMAGWLEEPQPALGGKRPAELMDTAEGRGIVADLLARMQSGAYA